MPKPGAHVIWSYALVRILAERSPILLPLLAAGMLQNVDKQILRPWRIFGHPIADALYVMPFEDRVGMMAKSRS